MFETSTSSSSLLSNGSRSSQTDDFARSIDDLSEAAEQHLEQALKSQEDVSVDIKMLMQLLRQVRDIYTAMSTTRLTYSYTIHAHSAQTSLCKQAWGRRTGNASTKL